MCFHEYEKTWQKQWFKVVFKPSSLNFLKYQLMIKNIFMFFETKLVKGFFLKKI